MKYRIKVKVEFEECGDDIDCGVEGPGQVVLSEEDACSIDEVEAALMSASYEVMRQENSRHFEAISKKKARSKGIVVSNATPYRVDSEIGRFEFTTHSALRESQIIYDTAKSLFQPLKGKERYRTMGFRELAHFDGCTDSSYRKTTRRLNRKRKQLGATPVKFIQEGAEREGSLIATQLKLQAKELLRSNNFQDDGVPVNDEFELPARLTPRKAVKEALERVIETAPDGISVEDIPLNFNDYEDCDEVVNISVDDVLVKKQKPQRSVPSEDGNKKKRKSVYNNVLHVEHRNRRYIFNTANLAASLPVLLGLLLKNELLKKPLLFFTDGERSLKTNIFNFFSWHSNVRLILDWYHLSEKCRQVVSLTMKVPTKEKKEIVAHLRKLLWYGQVDKAIEYLQSFPRKAFKTSKDPDYLIGYLERKREHIPCYALRKELGLKNGSQMGEKSNDILIAERQKHNGMAWSSSGSESLGCLTAARFNGEMDNWLRNGTLTMHLREPEDEAAA